ncbi:unnamed protein product [Allacma fusca]|uniref:Uncharacterized protein n=1 Tax=Allacma fusca TaxID=39272 RepID=A0A8J2P869_9HEXA|nr:unnamed protein product [Allacma fusca]
MAEESGTGALKNTMLSLHKHGFLEMTIILLPTTLLTCHGFCLLVLAVDHKANYLLYASLPENYQTNTYFALTFALEAFSYALCFSPRYFTVYYILSILPRLKNQFRKLTSQYLAGSKSGTRNLKHLCGDLKKVQTEIKLINNVYSGLLYMDKLVLLFIVITGMSAGIYYLNVNPIFSGTILVLSIYSGVVLYVCLYGKLYEIPDSMENLKHKLLFLCRGDGIAGKSYVVKVIAGIPVCGLKAGSFYVLDRVTGPTFVDFVLRQVASLLIAFK